MRLAGREKLFIKTRLLIAAAFLVFAVTPLRAGTITVTSTNDSGPGSLRNALANAANGDTISISATGTILLTSGELLVTKNVGIVGPGPSVFAVNGNHASRVFHIAPSNTAAISSLAITNGYAFDNDSGGGLYNDHATLTVSNCTVTGNSSANFGGGIFSDGYLGSAALAIINSTLNSNSATQSGAGIYNFGYLGSASLTVVNSTLSGNTAASGGGFYNDGGDYTGTANAQVVHCTLSGNSADTGGAIGNRFATLTVADCTLSGNRASSKGGGVDNNSGSYGSADLTVVNSTLSGNSANEGGAIFNDGFIGSASLQIVNSTLSGNSANEGGGGIRNIGYGGGAAVQISNCTLNDNEGQGGSGIYNSNLFEGFVIGDATVEIGNTILSAFPGGASISNDSGAVTSLGYNLSTDGGGGALTNATDQINTDPMLGPLQDNGGPTFTHALLPGSPAIDAGDPNFIPPPDFDQRGPGFPRVVNGRIDIGALEVQAKSAAEQINNLIGLVQGLGLPSGTANSLVVKLAAAASALDRGNIQAACGNLGAFLNEVNAQKRKKLTAAQADLLIAEATRIRAVLGC